MNGASMAAAVLRGGALALALASAGCTSTMFDARTFEGTRWNVTAIDGRSVPLSGGYRIEFHNGRMSGSFGCNQWSGGYALAGDILEAREVASTKSACQGPATFLEREGLAVLEEPMRFSLIRGRRLMLANRKGSIALERRR